jgi:pseudo-rSAM protein
MVEEMTTNKDFYWFYLEPYTLILYGKNGNVIYNTLNSEYLQCPSNVLIDNLVNELLRSEDYCIKISADNFNDVDFCKFIQEIRHTFSGDYVACNDSVEKPFVFKPILKLRDNWHILKHKEEKTVEGNNILRYLNELSLYLTSTCSQSCVNCNEYYKQFLHCAKIPVLFDFPIKEVINILNLVEKNGIGKVNFSGGDIFKYKHLQELMPILNNYNFKKGFFIHNSHINNETGIAVRELLKNDCHFNIFIDANTPIADTLIEDNNVEYIIIVDSEESLLKALNYTESHPELKINICPFFNKQNISFFEDNVFMDLDALISIPISKKAIFRRQTLNESFFGKLTILPNGDTYANMNEKSLGNTFGNNTINKMVYTEMKDGSSWFKIRNEEPCADCCNKYLCPSPSNYEIIIGKQNLCHIQP